MIAFGNLMVTTWIVDSYLVSVFSFWFRGLGRECRFKIDAKAPRIRGQRVSVFGASAPLEISQGVSTVI